MNIVFVTRSFSGTFLKGRGVLNVSFIVALIMSYERGSVWN